MVLKTRSCSWLTTRRRSSPSAAILEVEATVGAQRGREKAQRSIVGKGRGDDGSEASGQLYRRRLVGLVQVAWIFDVLSRDGPAGGRGAMGDGQWSVVGGRWLWARAGGEGERVKQAPGRVASRVVKGTRTVPAAFWLRGHCVRGEEREMASGKGGREGDRRCGARKSRVSSMQAHSKSWSGSAYCARRLGLRMLCPYRL